MFKSFEKNLREKKLQGLFRRPAEPQGIDFSSNDCLNLSCHPKIRARMAEALEKGIPLSARSSRLISGATPWHEETDALLRAFLSREGLLSFSSGYLANVGILPALAKGEKAVFSDELNHASLIDGIRLSRAIRHIFPHRNLNALEDLLKKEKREKIIVTESLFSMGGDFAPLREISDLALKYQALLFVDEAHATGLFGQNFSGFASGLEEKEHIVSLHTGGKALGSSGAFVGCSRLIKDYLINNCRSFIYTTAPPPLLMVQWKAVLDVLKTEPFRPLELRAKSRQMRAALSADGSGGGPDFPDPPALSRRGGPGKSGEGKSGGREEKNPAGSEKRGRRRQDKSPISPQDGRQRGNLQNPSRDFSQDLNRDHGLNQSRPFKKNSASPFYPLERTESPILFLEAGSPAKALKKEKFLRRRGFGARAIRWPTVPRGKEGLRIVLKYHHKREELSRLKSALREAAVL